MPLNIRFIVSFCLLTSTTLLFGQGGVSPEANLEGKNGERIITPAVPFLMFTPDARAAGMGDLGVSTSPDANAIHWNAAKLSFSEKDMGLSLSYTPWLRKLINDMSINYVSGYVKSSKEEAFGLSLLYFNLGSMTLRNDQGVDQGEHRPRELALSGTYSRKLSKFLGVALAARFVNSNLVGNATVSGGTTKPARTFAVDISSFYTKPLIIQGKEYRLNVGGAITNIGGKVSYTSNGQKAFIPTNLRLGATIGTDIDMYNKINFSLETSKLMIPTPPVRDPKNPNDSTNILMGKDPNRSLVSGIFGSFSDAPGGFNEELKEFIWQAGVEYWYYDVFAVRGGYFNESKIKGNRKYFTLGLGIRYEKLGFDFAYLIPTVRNNPLQDTIRFSLLMDLKKSVTAAPTSITE